MAKSKKKTESTIVTEVKDIVVSELETTTIPANAYKNIFGSFGIVTRTGDKITSIAWEGCRDRFQNMSNDEKVIDFLFFHNDKAAENVIAFVRTMEKIVELPEADRLEFRKTNNANVLHVKMSLWWKYKLRRSLLTALLRCGQNYTDHTSKGFEKALYSQYYLAQTKPAVEQFMKGRTGSKLGKRAYFSGWYAQFVNQNEEKVRQTLVKVTPKTPEELEAIKLSKEAERAAKESEKANAELATAQDVMKKATEKAEKAAAKVAEAVSKKELLGRGVVTTKE